MSIESFTPIRLEAFGGLLTLPEKSDFPFMSPDCQDVEFLPGLVKSRPGAVVVYTLGGGTVKVNGIHPYITFEPSKRVIVLTSNSTLQVDKGAGFVTLSTKLLADARMMATTLFNKSWMAIFTAIAGGDLPVYYDDIALRRVGQVGPGSGPAAADTGVGTIVAGIHKVVCIFETSTGYLTRPSPPVSWSAAGSKQVSVTNIPTGSPNGNVIRRRLAFTAKDGETFFHLPDRMVLEDNTTTTLTVDFNDTELLAGENVDYLFRLIELPKQIGVIAYQQRLFWWGEHNRMHKWRNLTFDGGFEPGGEPRGWTQGGGGSFAGGSQQFGASDVIFGSAYNLTGTGIAVNALITQSAVTDAWDGTKLIRPNTEYRIRARVKKTAGLVAGILNIDLEAAAPVIDTTGLSIGAGQLTTSFQEFEADLTPPGGLSVVPADLKLRVFGETLTTGETIIVDEIEIWEKANRWNKSLVRASLVDDPESYDELTGFMQVAENNGQAMRSAFVIRDFLYFVKERSLFATENDGSNPPAFWPIQEVSSTVGTASPHGVGIGEDWVVIASRDGAYYFSGGTPLKVSQEIQPTWERINWDFAHRIHVTVNTRRKQVYFGVPLDTAQEPSVTLVLDYTEGWTDPLENRGHGRKWSPWTIQANSAAFLTPLTSDSPQVWFGDGIPAGGRIRRLDYGLAGQLAETLNSYYWTPWLSLSQSFGRHLYGYLTMYAKGGGSLDLKIRTPDDVETALGLITLADPPAKDNEKGMNKLTERLAFRFGTDSFAEYWTVSKFVIWAKPDPWAYVRGSN